MKLHHLRLRGIGPFRDEVSLDFSALGASGLFLLEGPTGSGKSTILDAIVYALYGGVAGSEASGARIRSQFAPPTEPSVVDLVFETGSGIYRVRREPEYRRAKLRGTGTTREQAKALLWRLSSPELIGPVLADAAGQGAGVVPVATRLDEVGREIARAIGLSREQFTQTVLLPQGEFARFLRARTQDRQAVLTRVFGTEVFEEVEKQLEQMRRAAKSQVAEATGTLRTAVARFVEASGSDEDARASLDEEASALRMAELADAADAIVRDAEARGTRAEEAGAAAETAETAARTSHESARESLRRLRRREELDRLVAALADAAEAAADAERRVALHDAAGPVAAAQTRRETADRRAAEAVRARADAVEAALAEHPDLAHLAAPADFPGTASGDALTALARAAEAETTRAGELTGLVETEGALSRREQALTDRRTAHADLVDRARTTRESLDERPAEREALTGRRDTAREAAGGMADARVSAQEAEGRAAAARAAAARAAEVAAAEQSAATAHRAARDAEESEHALRRRRTDGLAAELALDLDDGEPCPVCGATAHPHPAAPGADHVSAEEVAAAEEARRLAGAAFAEADALLRVARERHQAAVEESGGIGVDEADAALAAARDAVRAAHAQAERATALEGEITRHDEETAARRERAQALAAEAGALAAAIDADAAALAADVERVRSARGDGDSVAARRDAHRARARTATALRESVLAADQAAARARELAAEVADALAQAGAALAADGREPFADEVAARAALLPRAEREGITETLRRRGIDAVRLADGLAEPGISETVADPEALDAAVAALGTAEAALAESSAVARAARAEAGRLAGTAQRTVTARTALDAAIAAVTEVRATAGTVLRVADLATGGSADGERIRLSTFVLMRRFEDVISAANARLALLSGANLELVRDTSARGAQRTGLDLLVIDRRTDQARVPETLSGGETFFVSLALALGLADIVTAEAGGVEMQTLFIDEGFGSLDPERLDAVIEEIGHLADSGRTVGIVSHVAELKSRIPEQIHVRRRPDRTSEVTVTA
ncbi:AAA family ATPase [Brachybacterium huguangmaarense]